MGYKVIKDCIHQAGLLSHALHGHEFGEYQGGRYRIRILDEDMCIYMYLGSDIDYEKISGAKLSAEKHALLNYILPYYRCEHVEYKASSGRYIS